MSDDVIRWNRDAWITGLYFAGAVLGIVGVIHNVVLCSPVYLIGFVGVALWAWIGSQKVRSARIAMDANRLSDAAGRDVRVAEE